jgi:putative hydroxymethylpyrimidine transport system substrate-binding protein
MNRIGQMIHLKRAALALLTATALAAIAPGCGEKEEDLTGSTTDPTKIDLVLDFYVNPDHAGIYTALANGYFERAGLDVQPQVPSDPSAPIKQVAAGRAELAISYEPEVLLAKEEGLDVVAVAALVDEPLTSLISLPAAGIGAVADLRGKTVATAGIPYQTDYLETILAGAGLAIGDVQQIDVGLNLLPALLGGQADAILGGFKNVEGVDLTARGASPSIVPVDQLGVPTYDELVLVAKRSELDELDEELRLFLAALEKGTADAVADPAAAWNNVVANGEGLDPDLTRLEIDATLPLLAREKGKRYGEMNAEEWELFASWMADNELIGDVPDAADVLTNDLLPPD